MTTNKPQEVFKRYEKKYLLSTNQYQQLLTTFKKHLTVDTYGKHTICNIYFDTPDYELIRTSLSKPVYKEKLRLRSYGIPKANDTVYMELKKKFDGIVYKRRLGIPLNEAVNYLYHGQHPDMEHQIISETDWIMSSYDLKPAAYIAYERIAMFGNEDPNLRVTFDFNIRCRADRLNLEKEDFNTLLLEPGQILMELKIPNAMPLWMSQVFSQLRVFPISYSKYGTFYQNYLLKNTTFTGGIHCA